MTNMTNILLLARHRSARVVSCILLAVTGYQALARHRSPSLKPLGHRHVAAQHCAAQLPQCSMVALSILEGMGVGGEGPRGAP
jgi:hypothetical protein